MSEIELLKELVASESKKHELTIRFNITKDLDKKGIYTEAILEINREIIRLENELIKIDDNTYSYKAKKAIIRQLNAYVIEINKVDPNLKLLRSQGLALENYLFSGILQDIKYLIQDEVFGCHIPCYLYYTSSNEDSVEISDLTNFLNKEISILQNLPKVNYIVLRQFYCDFIKRLSEEFL